MPGLSAVRTFQEQRDRIEIRRNERIEATRAREGLPSLGYRVSPGYGKRTLATGRPGYAKSKAA
jgi:hypothetical protein